ncbi:hypothetical protein RFI_00360 [Reticulomyxa filosa]|uniref:RecQ mediated genome instability protein 1 OB-fold domain-containing protein n=1 Tax=Reticulomyxa filosa TaxID=46433 RepID=X6PF18_RETFI|nr:hypothetical protein RFI_00360 [Reticulomyxa filosa]|eukprot:ETO36703.1 hypothetical protein RFI_00360 [Reticulomyxa filosa]
MTTEEKKITEKVNYEKYRKVLIEKYGLWLEDHFFRKHTNLTNGSSIKDLDDKKLFELVIEDNFRTVCQPFLEKLISNQLDKVKEVGSGSPCITIKGLMLLQIFSVRDIASPSHTQDLLKISKSQNRVILLTLLDGSTKINAVEVEHIPLFDDQQLLPGMKIQLKNVEIREKIIEKFQKFRDSKQADTRIFNKHIGKNETPPPPFEVLDSQSRGKQNRFTNNNKKKKNPPRSLGIREDQQSNNQEKGDVLQQQQQLSNEGEDEYYEYYEYYDENEIEEKKNIQSESYVENDEREGDDFAFKDLRLNF